MLQYIFHPFSFFDSKFNLTGGTFFEKISKYTILSNRIFFIEKTIPIRVKKKINFTTVAIFNFSYNSKIYHP